MSLWPVIRAHANKQGETRQKNRDKQIKEAHTRHCLHNNLSSCVSCHCTRGVTWRRLGRATHLSSIITAWQLDPQRLQSSITILRYKTFPQPSSSLPLPACLCPIQAVPCAETSGLNSHSWTLIIYIHVHSSMMLLLYGSLWCSTFEENYLRLINNIILITISSLIVLQICLTNVFFLFFVVYLEQLKWKTKLMINNSCT